MKRLESRCRRQDMPYLTVAGFAEGVRLSVPAISVMALFGIALWLIWIASTVLGYLLGAVVADPKRYALDLVMPVFFTVMLVPLWSGPRRAIAWAVAGVVALVTAELVPGSWYIIAGTVAGTFTAGWLDERA